MSELKPSLFPYLREKAINGWHYVYSFVKWVLIASAIGVISGLVGSAFQFCVQWVNNYRQINPWLIWLLPVAGLLIAGMYKVCKLNEYTGTNLVIDSVRGTKRIPFALAPLIFLGTVITHLTGGSAGREGAALQLGGTIGMKTGRLLHVDPKEFAFAIMCGMSGVFAALFGTPVTAAFFAMEVISVGVYYHSGFIPCFMSAYVAYRISRMFGLNPVHFDLSFVPETTWHSLGATAVLAALCALVSILFCVLMHKTQHFLQEKIPNDFVRNSLGGVIILILTLLVGSQTYNGTGINTIQTAIQSGTARPEAFLLKILFTAITIGAGFKGGEIVPAFFIGSTFGCTFGSLLGLDPGFCAAIGLIAVFCGSVNCPIASVFLSIEIFGPEGLVLFVVACAVSYMLSGYYGLYSSQKIVYSKLKAEYINIYAR